MDLPVEVVNEVLGQAHRRALRVRPVGTTDRGAAVAALHALLKDEKAPPIYWLDHVVGSKFRVMTPHPKRGKMIPEGEVIDATGWRHQRAHARYILTGQFDYLLELLGQWLPDQPISNSIIWGQPRQVFWVAKEIAQKKGQAVQEWVTMADNVCQSAGAVLEVGTLIFVGDHPCGVRQVGDRYQYLWSAKHALAHGAVEDGVGAGTYTVQHNVAQE